MSGQAFLQGYTYGEVCQRAYIITKIRITTPHIQTQNFNRVNF